MMPLSPRDGQKRAAALAAVDEVEAGMLVGLGTGTTAAFAIAALGERCRAGLRIEAVATSRATEAAAKMAGLTILDFSRIATIDLCIDGVDEIDPGFHAIKGGGGAMLREKVVANAARRMIAIADATKPVAALGQSPLPVEILPFACAAVTAKIDELGGEATLRGQATPFVTDQANWILDCRFAAIPDPVALSARLSAIPGLLGHGLFLDEIDALYLGTVDGVVKSDKAAFLSGNSHSTRGSITEPERSTVASRYEADPE